VPCESYLAAKLTWQFWSNFEIADLDMYRGEAYLAFFDHLDKTGKFFYERWGDAPVHSLFVSLFLNKSELHWFGDFAYCE